MRDELFRDMERVGDFTFDDHVARVFDDMLDRSVPFYHEIQRMVVELGIVFLETGGTVYDVGCSTGNTLLGFAQQVPTEQPVDLVGIEPAAAMRQKASEKFDAIGQPGRVKLLADPIERFESLSDARVVVMLYTLQFVRPLHRPSVLKMIYNSLETGGCLLLAEKILPDHSMLNRIYIELYHDYKRRAGYTGTEIAKKRESLENVLVPYRDTENRALLNEAGFSILDHIFRWYNFAAYIAVKN